MSLMNSIFGGAPAAAKSPGKEKETKPDLFGLKLSVPAILHKKSPSAKKKGKKADPKNVDADKTKDQSSSNDKDESSTSDSASKQPTTADDAQIKESTSTSIVKKTKEQLKEEEERTIFVGNLPTDISRRGLAGIFKPCGKIASARLRSVAVTGVKLPPDQAGNQNMMRKVCANTGKILSDTPKKSAQGYVVFESVESIKAALEMNNTPYESQTIRVDHAAPTTDSSRSVFVGNLPYGADEETLRDHFFKHLSEGEDLNEREGSAISGVRIIRDKETQKCKGFGYVTLRDATLVPLALALHGSKYMKRELRVMICGKRFKGKRGSDATGNKSGAGRRAFEGQRAYREPLGMKPSSKRKSEEGPSSGGNSGGKTKKRRARSEKKTAPGSKPGMSKRAATEQKVNKRVKKLEKRAQKGSKNKK